MLSERDRFLIFFDRIVRFSDECYARCADSPLLSVSDSVEGIRYGERIPSVTPTSLYVHMTVVEHHWTSAICSLENGQVVSVARDPVLSAQLSEGDVAAKVGKLNQTTLERLAALPSEQLKRVVFFVGRQYTVIGFLWGFLAHRTYHVGNLDFLMRSYGVQPPDFFDFSPQQMA